VCGVPGRLKLVPRSRLDIIDVVSAGSILDAAVCIDALLDLLDNILPIFQRPEEVDFCDQTLTESVPSCVLDVRLNKLAIEYFDDDGDGDCGNST
jgi:hypothetical protein